jgi:fucose 4-O-acetylase-like acetyltransferase
MMAPTLSPQKPASRLLWVDVARGVGILLVVYAHAIRGLTPVPADLPGWALQQDHIIYAFHMPLFFFLSGLFIWPSLERGRRAFLKDRALTVLYPYLLWSLIVGLLEMLARPFVNSPIELRDIYSIPWRPIEQFWFLYALFALQLVALLLYPRRRLFIASAIVLPILAASIDSSLYLRQVFTWLPFLVLGMLLAPALHAFAAGGSRQQFAVAAGAWLLFALLLSIRALTPPLVFFYAAGGLGTIATVTTAMLLRSGRPATLLAWLGAASMAIFVMHSVASAAIRTGSRLMWPDIPLLPLLIITFVAGMVLPAAVYMVARQLGYLTWLGLGRDKAPNPNEALKPQSPRLLGQP